MNANSRSDPSVRPTMSGRSAATHERILEAAAALLSERGFHGVGMGEVARAAGISRQALYLHFASKSELFVAASEYVVARAEARVTVDGGREGEGEGISGRAPEPASEAEQRKRRVIAEIDEIIRLYARTVPETYGIATANYAARRSEPAAEEAWQNRTRVRLLAYTRTMAHLSAAGGLAEGWTEQEAADFLFALLSVRGYETLVLECGWSLERYEDRLRAVVYRTLIRV